MCNIYHMHTKFEKNKKNKLVTVCWYQSSFVCPPLNGFKYIKWFQYIYLINEVSRRKSTAKAKLKAASQQERVKLWKQHFENLLGNPPKVTNEPITRIISKQLDIKLGLFTKEELDSVLRKIKNRKAAGLEIPPEVWKTRQFDDILLWQCNAVYN